MGAELEGRVGQVIEVDVAEGDIVEGRGDVLGLDGDVADALLLQGVKGRDRHLEGWALDHGAGDEGLGRDPGLGKEAVLHGLQEVSFQQGEQEEAREAHGDDDDRQVAEGQAGADAGKHRGSSSLLGIALTERAGAGQRKR